MMDFAVLLRAQQTLADVENNIKGITEDMPMFKALLAVSSSFKMPLYYSVHYHTRQRIAEVQKEAYFFITPAGKMSIQSKSKKLANTAREGLRRMVCPSQL